MSFTRVIKNVVSGKNITLFHMYSHFENTYWLNDGGVTFYSIIVEADMMVLTNNQNTPKRKKAVKELLAYIHDTHDGEELELVGVNYS